MARGEPGEQSYEPTVGTSDLLPRKLTPREEPISLQPALDQVTGAIQQKYQADSATWAGAQLADLRSSAVQQLETMKQGVAGGEPGNFTEQYLSKFDQQATPLIAATQGSTNNAAAYQMLSKGITQLRDTLADHTLQWEATQRVAYRADAVQQHLKQQLPAIQAHPELGPQVGSTLMDELRASGASAEQFIPAARMIDSTISGAMADGLTRQDPQGALKALNDPNSAPPSWQHALEGLSDEGREALRAHATGLVGTQIANPIVDTYRQMGPSAGAQALAAVDKMAQPDEIKQAVYAQVEHGISQWREEAQQTNAPAIMGLESRLASQSATSGDIGLVKQLYQKGVFSPEQAGSTMGRIQASLQAQIPDDTFARYAQQAYQNGVALDPTDKELQKGMAQAFANVTKGAQPGSLPWINQAADMAKKTGIVPAPAVSWARAQITSGNPDAVAAGAETISRLQIASPLGIDYALKEDKETKALVSIINEARDAGTPALQAVENARKIVTTPELQKQLLEQRYDANGKTKVAADNAAQLGILFGADQRFDVVPHQFGLTHSPPPLPPAMVGEFETLVRDYYKVTDGDLPKSRQLAFADLKNVWGVSSVNGAPEFMMYAPEAQGRGYTADAIRAGMAKAAEGKVSDPSTLKLVPSADTVNTNGQTWNIAAPNKFGLIEPVLDDKNNPIVLQLPSVTQTQEIKSQATQAIQDRLTTARKAAEFDDLFKKQVGMDELRERLARHKLSSDPGTYGVAAGN